MKEINRMILYIGRYSRITILYLLYHRDVSSYIQKNLLYFYYCIYIMSIFLYKKLPSHFIFLLRKIDKCTKPMDLTRPFKYLYTYFLRKKIY